MSEDMRQDAAAAGAAIEKVLHTALPDDYVLKHLVIVSDNCCTQFKCSAAFVDMALLAARLGCVVTRCYATAGHFKGEHDGLGGVVKKLARAEPQANTWSGPATALKPGRQLLSTGGAANFVRWGNNKLGKPGASPLAAGPAHAARCKLSSFLFVEITADDVAQHPLAFTTAVQGMRAQRPMLSLHALPTASLC